MNFLIRIIALVIFVCFINTNIDSKNSLSYIEFKAATHKEINSRTLKKVLGELNLTFEESKFELCKTRLIRSQFLQDLFLQSNSKAHFDNCAFQKSINYINRLIRQNEEFAEEYLEELAEGEEDDELELLSRKILFNLGKILHAIQDFYSHTNYLEIMKTHKNLDNIPTLKFWEKEDQNKIIKLQEKGLISGVAWWVFPKKCPKNSPSHKDLAKDNEKYKLGKKKTFWIDQITKKNLNGYEVALYLAEKSTYQFLLHSFNKYPMLKSYCANVKL